MDSLKDLIESSCERFAPRDAYVQADSVLGYQELEQQSRAFGAWLQKMAGFEPGERILIMLPNVLEFPIAMFGALRAGLTIVNANLNYTAGELERVLVDSGAACVVISENRAHSLQKMLSRTAVKRVVVTSIGSSLGAVKDRVVDFFVRCVRRRASTQRIEDTVSFQRVLCEGSLLMLERVPVAPEDVAFIQYADGDSAGVSRAALTHRDICSNVLQTQEWLHGRLGNGPATLITPVPLYHAFALTASCLLFLRLGWSNVLIADPNDVRGLIKSMKKHRCTYFAGVSSLFEALLKSPGFDRVDFTLLRTVLCAGTAAPSAVCRRWKIVTGRALTQGWALSENSPVRPETQELPRGAAHRKFRGSEAQASSP